MPIRINITFRKALVRAGTENYYQYNVGTGGVYRWDAKRKVMIFSEDEETTATADKLEVEKLEKA